MNQFNTSYLCARCINREEDWRAIDDGDTRKTQFCLYSHGIFPAARQCKDYEDALNEDRE
jgi:hypothetical protein